MILTVLYKRFFVEDKIKCMKMHGQKTVFCLPQIIQYING